MTYRDISKVLKPPPVPMELPSCSKIRAAVCRVYGLRETELQRNARHKTLVEARSVAMWFVREIMKFSFPELGREFHRDHSTCIVAVRKIARDRETRPILAERMALIAGELMPPGCAEDTGADTHRGHANLNKNRLSYASCC